MSQSATLLVIDDEPQIRKFLRISLSSQGYKVVAAFSKQMGPYTFSAISTRKDIDPQVSRKFVSGIDRALKAIHKDPEAAVASGLKLFPNLDPAVVRDVIDRLQLAARGAAMGTGTEVVFEPTGGVYSLLPNDALGRVMQASLQQVGGVIYDAADTAFATQLQQTLQQRPALAAAAMLEPYRDDQAGGASTDVGDVSWNVPTVGLSTATWVPWARKINALAGMLTPWVSAGIGRVASA